MRLVEDRPLLDAFRRGEPAALETVYREYAPAVAGLLRSGFSFSSGGRSCRFRGAQSTFDLEDRLQDTFARAFGERARQGYDGLSPFRAYLATIAKNLVIDEFRKKESALTDFAIEEQADDPLARGSASDPVRGDHAPSGHPLQDAEGLELNRLVKEFRATLDEREQEIYRLRFVDELEHRDIAERTGLSASRVKTSEKRIRLGFFQYMRGKGYFTGYEQQPSGWLRLLRGR